jgi:hypothetical protein
MICLQPSLELPPAAHNDDNHATKMIHWCQFYLIFGVSTAAVPRPARIAIILNPVPLLAEEGFEQPQGQLRPIIYSTTQRWVRRACDVGLISCMRDGNACYRKNKRRGMTLSSRTCVTCLREKSCSACVRYPWPPVWASAPSPPSQVP